MRIRITFSKNENMRYTGHLDLHRTWERTLRRAGLPLAYSQGFNPHARINLAAALPLGFTSEAEIVDAWLEEDLPLDEIAKKLTSALPPGIQIHTVRSAPDQEPSLQTQVKSAEYLVTFLDPFDGLEGHLSTIMGADSLPRQRRGKPYDLRPLIEAAEQIENDAEGHARLRIKLASREGATGRPEELILALGGDPNATRVRRTQLFL